MRVLWLCNIMLPAFAAHKGLPSSVREGWLSGSLARIRKSQGAQEHAEKFTLGICFPAAEAMKEELDGITYYTFRENLQTPEVYDASMEARFQEILADFSPDLVHIYGTEFPHALAMVRTFQKPERTLVWIQGLCGKIAEHYLDGLPEEVCRAKTFRDLVRGDALSDQKRKFEARAVHEEEVIRSVKHIAGRTAFDKEESLRINPEAHYHEIHETLRTAFYHGRWKSAQAKPHSIFLAQGDYPLKGFHVLLQALPDVLRTYPDAHVYVGGNSVIGGVEGGSLVPLFVRIGAYGKYLKRLISQLHLQRHVTMRGILDETQMKAQYLESALFVCPSAIENSPNTLGEAMLLGVPCIASDTGGIPSMLTGGKDGLLFAPGDAQALSDGIRQIFDEKVISYVYGDNARHHAAKLFDREENFLKLMETYAEIAG